MAANPILTIGEGVIEIPEELRDDPRFRKGQKLMLVPLRIQPADEALPVTSQAPNRWRALRGSLATLDVRLTDEMEKDRLAELALDWRMLGGNAASR